MLERPCIQGVGRRRCEPEVVPVLCGLELVERTKSWPEGESTLATSRRAPYVEAIERPTFRRFSALSLTKTIHTYLYIRIIFPRRSCNIEL